MKQKVVEVGSVDFQGFAADKVLQVMRRVEQSEKRQQSLAEKKKRDQELRSAKK